MKGKNVGLAALRDDDLPLLFTWINDRNLVVRSAPFKPVDEAAHRRWFEEIRDRPDVEIFGIRLNEDDRLIGYCQLLAIDRDHGTAELRIRIGEPTARGAGLGTEAVRLLLRRGFDARDLHRIELHVFATNGQAIRSYEKAGFKQEGTLREAALIDGERTDVIVMGILRGELADGE